MKRIIVRIVSFTFALFFIFSFSAFALNNIFTIDDEENILTVLEYPEDIICIQLGNQYFVYNSSETNLNFKFYITENVDTSLYVILDSSKEITAGNIERDNFAPVFVDRDYDSEPETLFVNNFFLSRSGFDLFTSGFYWYNSFPDYANLFFSYSLPAKSFLGFEVQFVSDYQDYMPVGAGLVDFSCFFQYMIDNDIFNGDTIDIFDNFIAAGAATVDIDSAYYEGHSVGYITGYDTGYNIGLSVARDSGYNAGYSVGYSAGLIKGAEGMYDESTLQDAYNRGVSDATSATDTNKKLPDLVKSLFSGMFDGVHEFFSGVSRESTLFGLSVGELVLTILAIGIAIAGITVLGKLL